MSTDFKASIRLDGDAQGVSAAAQTAGKALDQVAAKADDLAQANQALQQSTSTSSTAMAAHAQATRAVGQAHEAASRQMKLSKFEMQQVSYQLNDFFVQVASGQSPITALVQQGSQLSGTFGGIGGAVRAVASLITPMVVGLTTLVSVVGGVGYAFVAGFQQSAEFNRSLILTGNYVGLVGGQLDDMGLRVAKANGVTVGAARETLQALVSSGKVTRDNLEPAAQAVESIARLSGQSRDDVVKNFDGMSSGVAKFAAKMNESYHFLSYAQYKHIQQLEEEGRAVEAQRLVYDAVNTSLGTVVQHLGTAERAWQSVKDMASGAWNAFLGIGRESSLQERLQKVSDDLRARVERGPLNEGSRDAFERGNASLRQEQAYLQESIRQNQRAAEAKSANAQAQEAAIKADQKWTALADSVLSKQEQMRKALKEASELAKATGQSPAALAKVQAGIREKFADKESGGLAAGEPLARAQLKFDVADIADQLKLLTDAYGNAEKILQAQRAAGLVDDKTYYAAKRAFLALDEDAQVDAIDRENERLAADNDRIDAELARIQGLKGAKAAALVLQREKVENEKAIQVNLTKTAKLQEDAAAQTVVLGIQEKAAVDALVVSYAAARMAAQDYLDTTRRQQQRQLDAVGMSDRQRAYGDGRNQIDEKYLQQQQALENNRRLLEMQEKWTPQAQAQYDQQLALLKEFHEKASADWDDYYARRTAAENNWANGASRAIQNYIDESANMAKQTESVMVKAFGGMEDALVKFAQHGKLDFNSLADAIIADLIRIQVRAQMARLLGGNTSGLMGVLGTVFGGNSAPVVNGSAGNTYVDPWSVVSEAHTGGVLGTDSLKARSTHPSVFTVAPRFHTGGILGDELPIIGKRGEGMFTEAQMRALAPVSSLAGAGQGGAINVTVVNQTGVAANATARRTEDGGIEVLLTAVEEHVATNLANGIGPVNAALGNRFGLRPSMA